MEGASISGDGIGRWAEWWGRGRGGEGIGGRRSIKRYETFLMNVALTHQSELLPRADEKKTPPSVCVRACVRACVLYLKNLEA